MRILEALPINQKFYSTTSESVRQSSLSEGTDVVQPVDLKGYSVDSARVSERYFKNAADKMNKSLEASNTSIRFIVHKETKELIVKIVDDKTGEVKREIPSEKALDIFAGLMKTAGLLVDVKR